MYEDFFIFWSMKDLVGYFEKNTFRVKVTAAIFWATFVKFGLLLFQLLVTLWMRVCLWVREIGVSGFKDVFVWQTEREREKDGRNVWDSVLKVREIGCVCARMEEEWLWEVIEDLLIALEGVSVAFTIREKVHFSYFSSAAVVVVVARSHHQLVVQFPFLQKHYQQS